MTSHKGHSCRHLGTVPKYRQIGTLLCKVALKTVPNDQSFKNVPNDRLGNLILMHQFLSSRCFLRVARIMVCV